MTITDLSADGLAKLEAQLLADLEMVRRVRELVVTYAGRTDMPAAVKASPAEPQTESTDFIPAPPQPDPSQAIVQALHTLPESGFYLADLNTALMKMGRRMNKLEVKLCIRRLVSQGKVQVVEHGTGRKGSRYKSLLSPAVENGSPDEG